MAVRNGRRFFMKSCSVSPATKMVGSTRASVWFSIEIRSGPGRISMVGYCGMSRSKMIDRDWRSRIGSPFTSRNCAVWVTGSKMIRNSAGSCSDTIALSPAGRSSDSIVTASNTSSKSSGISRPRPEIDLAIIFDGRQVRRGVRGDPAHPRRHREGHLDHLVEGRL